MTVLGDNAGALFGASANAFGGVSVSTADFWAQELGDEIKGDLKDFHQLGEAPWAIS